jgi:uncharacterized protein YuzE
MKLTYTEDTEAGAAYLSFGGAHGKIVSTLEYQQDKNIDFDADGNIVGIEFLSLPPTIDFSGLEDYVKLEPTEVVMIQDFLATVIK